MGLSYSHLRGNGGGSASLVAAEHSLPDGNSVLGRVKVSSPTIKATGTTEALWFRQPSDQTSDLFVWGGVLARLEKLVESIPRHAISWHYWIGLCVGFVCTIISFVFFIRLMGSTGRLVGYFLGAPLMVILPTWAHSQSEEHKRAVAQSKEAIDAAVTEVRTTLPTGYTLVIQREEDCSSTALIDLCRSDAVVGPLPPVDRAVELHLPLSLDMFTKNTHHTDGFDVWTHGAIMVTLRTVLEPYMKADKRKKVALIILSVICYIFWFYPGGLIANNSFTAWGWLGLSLIVGMAAVASLVWLYSNIVEGPGRHVKCQQCLEEVAPAVYDRIGYQMTYEVVPLRCAMGMTKGVLIFSRTRTRTSTTGGNIA